MTTPEKTYRIVKLTARNFLKLRAIEITPDGDVVQISGRNGQGKTSILRSIECALSGASSIPERPIREGQSNAEIVCDLGDIIVTRTFSASGGSGLTVKAKDGTKLSTPQAVLDKLTNTLSYDPLRFCAMHPSEQVETLRKIVGIDFSEIDGQRKKYYDDRTQVGRDLVKAKSNFATAPTYPDLPDEEQSLDSIVAEIKAAQATNAKNHDVRSKFTATDQAIVPIVNNMNSISGQITALEQKLKEARAALKLEQIRRQAQEDEIERQKIGVAALVDVDVTPLTNKITTADGTNAKIRAKKRSQELKVEVERLEKRQKSLTEWIEDIDREKEEKLAATKFPIKEITFGDTGVLLNGLPFAQGSQALQLRASVAIALALNPRLKIMLVRNGNDLDSNGMALLAQLAAENGAQAWVERVEDSPSGGAEVFIEDGSVVEAQ